MVAVYVTSPNGPEGKTALCIGLGKRWQKAGKKVGYLKPVAISATEQAAAPDVDAAFARKALGLAEPAELLCPLSVTSQAISGLGKRGAPDQKVTRAYGEVAAGKDVVLLDGISGQPEASAAFARSMGAKVIVVAHYRTDLVTELPKTTKAFGPALVGAVINAVPREKLDEASTSLAAALKKTGIRVLGALPADRVLASVTVRDLIEPLQAKPVTFKNGLGAPVENIMGGAVFLDPGPLYFGRKANKAVVVRIDRPDLQLGSLETSVRCLVLTNAEGDPNPYVYYKAQDKDVPILLTKMDTHAALAAIETLLNGARFHDENKVSVLGGLIDQYLDLAALNKAVGL